MDISYLSAAEAGALFRDRALSPVELTRYLLARIGAVDGMLHAFIHIDEDAALVQAQAAERDMMAGVFRGPLHGIPCAVKDNIDVAGMPTTCHSKIAPGNGAHADSTVASRLRAAGAVILGKTALHEFAIGGPAQDLPWPPARNPWDPSRHPGGSSSGSGAALAAGLVAIAIGTDTGGSIRNPATACGMVGMKPTFGLVGRTGIFPLTFTLDHAGPMTRTVADNAAVMQVLAGFDPGDPGSTDTPPGRYCDQLAAGVSGLRIGVLDHFHEEYGDADACLVTAMHEAVGVLRKLGARVETARLRPLSIWNACGRVIQQVEQFAIHQPWLSSRLDDYSASSRAKLLAGAFVSGADYVRMSQLRARLCEEYANLMGRYDALIALSSFHLPCRIDDAAELARTYERQARMPFNLTGSPAIAVPTGYSDSGMPLGMQIAGKPHDEALLYRIAAAYERETGWNSLRPAI